MAGWSNKSLAKRQQAAHPFVVESRGTAASPERSDAPTLAEMLGLAPTELGGLLRPTEGGGLPPRISPPRLVASNTSPDLQLSRIVELEIIPRLMLMHSAQPVPRPSVLPVLLMTADHVHTLAHLAAEGDSESASRYVRALLDAGALHEQVFLDLLAPCARWLGELWEDDSYDFSQVTIGLWRLQRVLHEHGARFSQVARPDADSHRALMAAVPGAQHTFGVVMAAEFFSRAGWDVECDPRASWPDLQTRLHGDWFDMFGLSIATEDSIPRIASAILDMRNVSANQTLFVMVGGPMAAQMPDLARLCGADSMSTDAKDAVDAANHAVSQRIARA